MSGTRRIVLLFLIACHASMCGCGGGGTSMDAMKARAISRRTSDEPIESVEPTKPATAESAATTDAPRSTSEATAPPPATEAMASQPSPARPSTSVPTTSDVTPDVEQKATPTGELVAGREASDEAGTEAKSEAHVAKEATISNLEKLGRALAGYLQAERKYPSATRQGLSWRVLLLPYLGEKSLYEQFALESSWDDERNRVLLDKMPDVFRAPGTAGHTTSYLMVTGNGAIQPDVGANVYSADVEGTCIAIVEVAHELAVPWTKADDWSWENAGFSESLGGVSGHGFFAVLSNCDVAWISLELAPDQLRKLFLTSGGGDQHRFQPPAIALSLEEAPSRDQSENTAIAETTATSADAPPTAAPAAMTAARVNEPAAPAQARPATAGEVAKSLEPLASAFGSRDARPPVPDGSTVRRSRELVRELFHKRYTAAKTTRERLDLAKEMLGHHADIDGDLAGEFALLDTVKLIAITLGDVDLSMSSADRLAARFDFGDEDISLDTLTSVSRTVEDDAQRKALLERAEQMYFDYSAARQYSNAVTVSQLAIAAAKKSGDRALENKWSLGRARAEEFQKALAAAESALKVLKQTPEDQIASTAVGRYLCFYAGEWDNGLAILANCDDRSLRRIAELELAVPEAPEQKLKIAELWWSEADQAQPAEKQSMRQRASHWYQQALTGLPPGLERIQVERRIEEVKREST